MLRKLSRLGQYRAGEILPSSPLLGTSEIRPDTTILFCWLGNTKGQEESAGGLRKVISPGLSGGIVTKTEAGHYWFVYLNHEEVRSMIEHRAFEEIGEIDRAELFDLNRISWCSSLIDLAKEELSYKEEEILFSVHELEGIGSSAVMDAPVKAWLAKEPLDEWRERGIAFLKDMFVNYQPEPNEIKSAA
jgi:hypothetical protein